MLLPLKHAKAVIEVEISYLNPIDTRFYQSAAAVSFGEIKDKI